MQWRALTVETNSKSMWSSYAEILNLIIGSGIIGYLFFYTSRKRKERADADSFEIRNTKAVLEQKNSYIEDLKNEQLDLKREKEVLKEELKEARSNEARERDKVVNLYKQLSAVNVKNVKMTEQIAIARFHRCEEFNCGKRRPPREPADTEEKG